MPLIVRFKVPVAFCVVIPQFVLHVGDEGLDECSVVCRLGSVECHIFILVGWAGWHGLGWVGLGWHVLPGCQEARTVFAQLSLRLAKLQCFSNPFP